MSRKKKKPKSHHTTAKRAEHSWERLSISGESRSAVAVTVAWMLSLLVTLAAELIAIPAAIIARINPPPPGQGLSLHHVADLFLFVSLVTGLICAGFVPLVYRVRAAPPPRAIVITALVAGAIPLVTIFIRWLM